MAKSITGAVGRGGRNFPALDVMTVQYLLNCVTADQGGPSPELAVDGAVGPKTVAAIEKFQRASGCVCDGRIDPGSATLRVLQTKARDPYPNQPVSAGPMKLGGDPLAQKLAYGQPGAAKLGGDPLAQKLGYGQPGGKGVQADPFGQKGSYGQPGGKGAAVDPYGQKGGYGQPGGKGGQVDPFGQKGGGGKSF